MYNKLSRKFLTLKKCLKGRASYVLSRRIKPYLSPPLGNFPSEIFSGLPSCLGIQGYGYHGWSLGQPSPAIPSTAGHILGQPKAGRKNFKVSSHPLAPPPPHSLRIQNDTAVKFFWPKAEKDTAGCSWNRRILQGYD